VIDLHLHLIPGVDDGARTLDDALDLCRLAIEDGCETLVATPHRRRDEWPDLAEEELERRLAEIRAEVGDRLRLELGGEVRLDSELVGGLAAPGRGGAIPLAGSHYLLLELEPFGVGPDPAAVVARLAAAGWRSIVAHPELTPFLVGDAAALDRLADAGALFQLTAMSLTGEFGRAPRERAFELLDAGHAHFLASDAHRAGWRPTGLARARDEVARRWGDARASALTIDNPRAVLEDRDIPNAGGGA
jgi:protein-tyrosine phosphatase